MKNKPTSGKWQFNNEGPDDMHIEARKQDGSWKHICHVYTESHNTPRYGEAEANAKLIALAPELKAALINANNVLKMAALIDKSNTCNKAQQMCEKTLKKLEL